MIAIELRCFKCGAINYLVSVNPYKVAWRCVDCSHIHNSELINDQDCS